MIGEKGARKGGHSKETRSVECGHVGQEHAGRGMCTPCYTRWRYENNRVELIAKSRAANIRYQFGITKDDYDNMIAAQDGKCAICKQPCSSGKSLAIDHDHKTGRIRGLLCTNCNTGLGKFKDDLILLSAAMAYLGES